jgi:hypothetical protein
VSIIEMPQDTYKNAQITITNPKHNPSESIVCLSVSLTVFLLAVLPSVASQRFPSVTTPCSLANYTAGTHQQYPSITQRVHRSQIDQHCTCSVCFCLLLNSPLFPTWNLIVLLCVAPVKFIILCWVCRQMHLLLSTGRRSSLSV